MSRAYFALLRVLNLIYAFPSFALDHLLYGGNGTVKVDSGLSDIGVMYGVAPNGDLLWRRYAGHGQSDRSGATGWDHNSSNPIGNGWSPGGSARPAPGEFRTRQGLILHRRPAGSPVDFLRDLQDIRMNAVGRSRQ